MKKQVLLFLLMLMPLMASADIVQIDGIYYGLNQEKKQAEVTRGSYTGNVVIPQTVKYDGVSYSVISIGKQAFLYSFGLISVIIPNSVTSIGDYAFQECSNLTSITIGNGVKSFGIKVFDKCSNLTSVNITDIATWCDISFSIYAESNPLYYAHHLFLNGTEVKDLVIPNGVSSIGRYAFNRCTSLTSVSIPNSVTSIGDYAFQDCSNLTSVSIPYSVSSIGRNAFLRCTGLTSVTIGNGVTSIGLDAFRNCSGLTSITIPNSVKSLGSYSFSDCKGLTSVTIGNGVTSIGSFAFKDCSGLTSVTIGNSVTSIEWGAFSGCSSLTSVIIPNSVTTIGSNVFSGCSGLTSMIIPEGVKTIEKSVFTGCRALTTVTLPSTITSIGDYAFDSGNNLTTVTVGMTTPVAIFSEVFPNRANSILYVPKGSGPAYTEASYWKEFKQILELKDETTVKCEKPIITLLASGKIRVESATEGATCITNIATSNSEPIIDAEISLNNLPTIYTITAYATKEGFDDSEVATLQYEKVEGDMNGDGTLSITDVIHLVNMILGQ